jgi:uncharacterized protein
MYCYYLEKSSLFTDQAGLTMSDEVLEEYIKQHIKASIDPIITFSWHGGEPTLLGIDYFKKIVAIQNNLTPAGQTIANAIQTNGTLLDEAWCHFLSENNFVVGLSLDGPRLVHDQFRIQKNGKSTFDKTIRTYRLLQRANVYCDLLCVINGCNVKQPLEVYRFFKDVGAPFITFFPLVESPSGSNKNTPSLSITAEDFGNFLCEIFDEWKEKDIDTIKINIFEETLRLSFNQEQALCVFRKTCGDIPVVEHNGNVYSCDHYVSDDYLLGNIQDQNLIDLLESHQQKTFGRNKWALLPDYCLKCEVLQMCHGGCPKNRILNTPDGKPGLNYLCAGYKQFFKHFQPFLKELSSLWQLQSTGEETVEAPKVPLVSVKVGRNDPCPCGSGKKFKKCCQNI